LWENVIIKAIDIICFLIGKSAIEDK